MTIESTAISRPRPPDLIPGYRLEKLVGKGGMGEVYKGVQLSLDRPVAVKLLAAELVHDPSFVARFEKEAAALAALSHPHIVSIVDKGNHKDTYYLVMEFVDGPSLREIMRSPSLDVPSALRMALDICRAIEYAHGRGVVHRDLKPENILFDEQAGGIPKVTDFGLAGFLDAGTPSKFNVTETHISMGTLSYMAPEQRVDAKTADHRADIYSLGVILYELLVGEVPMGNFDPPSQKKEKVDKRLDPIVAKCLKPEPSDRYQSVADLLFDLEPVIPVTFSQRPRKLTPLERAKHAVDRAVRRAIRVAAMALVASAALVLLVAGIRVSRGPVPKLTAADGLAVELESKGALTASGRITEEGPKRTATMGDGPDQLTFVAFGRGVVSEAGAIKFAGAAGKANIGRAALDLTDIEAREVSWSADVTLDQAPPGFGSTLKRLFLGAQREPRTGLVLSGGTGRYAAVLVSGGGEPVEVEWALAERRGTMIGPPSPRTGSAHLEISVDKSGELRAFSGTGKDRRPVGEPVSLGADWRKYFDKTPNATMVCIEGGCDFTGLVFEAMREPPPAPPPPDPVTQAKENEVKQAAGKGPAGSKAKKTTVSRAPPPPPVKKRKH